MPAGVPWSEYLKFMSCALLSMMAGSQLVHMYYNPLKDLNKYIENEVEEVAKTTGIKIPALATTEKKGSADNGIGT